MYDPSAVFPGIYHTVYWKRLCEPSPSQHLSSPLKKNEALSDIHVRLEAIICEELPPLLEITNHLKIIWRDIYG